MTQPPPPPSNSTPGAIGWGDLISGSGDPAIVADSAHNKSAHVDYQNLGPIYGPDDVAKNTQQLDMTDILNAILQMAYNKLYIPLLMLTTAALLKIQMNDNLKFHKVPFGNGIGKQSLDKVSFPGEDSLTETTFLQAYRNWLTIVDIIATADVAVGWYEHHSRMLRDDKFLASFDAWQDMDKQLHTQFIARPFTIDPYSPTYVQLLERSRMDSFFARAEKAQRTFELQWASRTCAPCASRDDASSSTSHRYTPYDKANDKGRPFDSFWENKKPTLCLRCGHMGHCAGNCSSMQLNRPERPIACDWRQEKLVSKSNKPICVMFNVRGACSDPLASHGGHICSLCGDGSHPVCRCPRN